jgi:hypothetical protein
MKSNKWVPMLWPVTLMTIVLSFSLHAEIPREIKEQISRDFNNDEEFKRAYVNYLESMDALYEGLLSEDKEKFKTQYLKHVKDKNCMFYLAKDYTDKMVKYAVMIESLQSKRPEFGKVQSLLSEFYPLNETYTKSPRFDGYKFCRFQVSQARIEKNAETIDDQAVLKSGISINEKSDLLFKDNLLLKQAMKVLFDDSKKLFTSNKLSKDQMSKLGIKMINDLSCSLYFTPEDKLESTMESFAQSMGELKSDPSFNKELKMDELLSGPMNELKSNLDGDYKKCSFNLDDKELLGHKTRKSSELSTAIERYSMLKKILETSHPKIKTMITEFEKSFWINGKSTDMSKKMFIKNFPEYMTQVDQVLTGSFYMLLKDENCKKDISEKLKLCMTDKRFSILQTYPNLLISMCTQEYKEELKTNCKFDH